MVEVRLFGRGGDLIKYRSELRVYNKLRIKQDNLVLSIVLMK